VQNPSKSAQDQAGSNVIQLDDQRPPAWSESMQLDLRDVSRVPRRRPRLQPWKSAAAVAGLTVAFLLGFMAKVAWLDRAIETELGEWRTVSLTDGTKVRVGPNSLLRVAFGDDHRTIRLVRGEAMFDVAKDRARPFYVKSEMVGVLAVGTEFRVSRLGGKDVVAVTEGNVALYRDGRDAVQGAVSSGPAQVAAATGGVALTAGDQVSTTRSTRSNPVAKEKVNADYEQAWAEGWLVYEDKTVAEMVGDFNRFNRLKIIVTDPSIAARRLTFFRGSATDPESFAAALATSPDIKVVRVARDVLRIERRSDAEISESPESRPPDSDVPRTVNPNPI